MILLILRILKYQILLRAVCGTAPTPLFFHIFSPNYKYVRIYRLQIISQCFSENSNHKKQEVLFRGVRQTEQLFFTPNFEECAIHSKIDPVPINRKSRRAMAKMIKTMRKHGTQ